MWVTMFFSWTFQLRQKNVIYITVTHIDNSWFVRSSHYFLSSVLLCYYKYLIISCQRNVKHCNIRTMWKNIEMFHIN